MAKFMKKGKCPDIDRRKNFRNKLASCRARDPEADVPLTIGLAEHDAGVIKLHPSSALRLAP